MKSRTFVVLAVLAALLAVAVTILQGNLYEDGEGPRERALFAASLPDLDGNPQSMEQYRGKVLVVNFWASWCPPCIEEMPGFVRLQDKYRDRDVLFVGIALDEPEAVQPFMRELGINYPVLTADIAGYDLLRAVGDEKGVMPFTLVIGRDGLIVDSKGGIYPESELDQRLASLI